MRDPKLAMLSRSTNKQKTLRELAFGALSISAFLFNYPICVSYMQAEDDLTNRKLRPQTSM